MVWSRRKKNPIISCQSWSNWITNVIKIRMRRYKAFRYLIMSKSNSQQIKGALIRIRKIIFWPEKKCSIEWEWSFISSLFVLIKAFVGKNKSYISMLNFFSKTFVASDPVFLRKNWPKIGIFPCESNWNNCKLIRIVPT